MLFDFLKLFRRWTVALLGVLSIVCLVTSFGARLPDQEICVVTYDYSTTRPGSYGNSIYDTTRGQYTRESRIPNFAGNIPSPNGKYFIVFKPVRHETELFDAYVQLADIMTAARLLQPSIWISSGSLSGIGDQFRWSKDGEQIAYLWSDRDKNVHLTVTNIDDNQSKTVTPFAKDPSKIFYSYVQEWSADNHYFTVIEQILNDTYYSFWDSDTLQAVSFPLSTTSMVRGVWSPQEHAFAAVLRNQRQKTTNLIIFNPDNSSSITKTALLPVDVQHLMWSPDSAVLILGYLSCKEANCRQQWYYDLFRTNGETIATDLTGTIQNSSGTITNTLYSPSGRIVMSGYNFNAMWSDDSKRFVYLEQINDDTKPIYSLKAIDFKNGEVTTLGTYPVVRSINNFFHTSQAYYFGIRILEGAPYVPISDQVIIPYSEAGKVTVILTGSAYDQPITLVRGADQIEPISNPYGQYQYWAFDGNDTSPIMIQWSTGKGTEKRVKLTTANADGGNIHTFDDGWSAIDNVSFITNADKPIMGFIGKKDGQFNLYVINLETGEQTLVLEHVQDSNDWVINLNPQQTLMAVNAGSSTANKGALYIRSVDDGSLIEVDPNANRYVAWSKDGEKLALTSGTKDGKQHFRIISQNGTIISDHVVSDDSTHLFIPIRWSKCY